MRIRFLQDYRVHAAGAEYDHPFPGVAEELVRQGVAAPAAGREAQEVVTRGTPYSLTDAAQPASLVVSLDQARHHLRLDALGATDADEAVDGYLTALILGATQLCELESRRRFVSRPMTLRLPGFPGRHCHGFGYPAVGGRDLAAGYLGGSLDPFASAIRVPVLPVTAVTAVTYADEQGLPVALSPLLYATWLEFLPPLIAAAPGATWPRTQAGNLAAVAVALTVGYGGPPQVPEYAKQAVRLTLSHWHERRGDGADPTTLAHSLGLPPSAQRLLDLLGAANYQ